MAISTFEQNVQDGGLGLSEGDSTRIHIALGVSSKGPVGELKFHTDPDLAKAEFGVGPLVDKAIYHLQNAGGPVGLMRLNASVAGVAGAVTTTRAGAGDSTGVLAVTLAPTDSYQVVCRITREGVNLAAGSAAFVLSLDGGDNLSLIHI